MAGSKGLLKTAFATSKDISSLPRNGVGFALRVTFTIDGCTSPRLDGVKYTNPIPTRTNTNQAFLPSICTKLMMMLIGGVKLALPNQDDESFTYHTAENPLASLG